MPTSSLTATAVWRRNARAALLLPALLSACQATQPAGPADNPELATYMQLIVPNRVKILSFTKPISIAGDGRADGIEAILALYDVLDEETKAAGTFNFELQSQPYPDRLGTRIGFWPVEITTVEKMRSYRDKQSKFYRIPLQLESPPLPAGRYIMSVWLLLPTGQRLYDEYELTYDGKGAPAINPP